MDPPPKEGTVVTGTLTDVLRSTATNNSSSSRARTSRACAAIQLWAPRSMRSRRGDRVALNLSAVARRAAPRDWRRGSRPVANERPLDVHARMCLACARRRGVTAPGAYVAYAINSRELSVRRELLGDESLARGELSRCTCLPPGPAPDAARRSLHVARRATTRRSAVARCSTWRRSRRPPHARAGRHRRAGDRRTWTGGRR